MTNSGIADTPMPATAHRIERLPKKPIRKAVSGGPPTHANETTARVRMTWDEVAPV
ncbi:hypothetical protein [Nostocoides sp. Soil756]|uniref:hypothetical protein n=1 Tax=Nostocoides sp. Soil756 TaxID=1736399 RepID=UPI0012F8D6C8|nr:hypothetical protein [Tetrasphaera sp. Soil756]